ncbi:hypothetical protein ACH5RR_019846 [Cinchona calisaya]|uniref:Uncharacterized protein n=1 Tax=Cinchona calisaya TaxID=153742 RepID=A0ABD2ZQJ5_9GENT
MYGKKALNPRRPNKVPKLINPVLGAPQSTPSKKSFLLWRFFNMIRLTLKPKHTSCQGYRGPPPTYIRNYLTITRMPTTWWVIYAWKILSKFQRPFKAGDDIWENAKGGPPPISYSLYRLGQANILTALQLNIERKTTLTRFYVET